MNRNDGGPAFPTVISRVQADGRIVYDDENGMSLRDYFAGQALPEVCRLASTVRYSHEPGNGVNDSNTLPWTGEAARAAYAIADAMIAERAK